MPLEEEFVRFLTSLNSSEAEFNKLSLVERSIIRTNFTSSTSSSSQSQQRIDKQELKEALKVAIKEVQAEKESSTIAFSRVSKGRVRIYLESINMHILEGEPLIAVKNNLVSFQPFQWLDAEEKDTPRAISHLEQELKKFGVTFGRGNYKMYDVHSDHSLLNLKDDKTGSLSGGTDLIIAPFGISMETLILNSCVAFEFKTEAVVDKEGLESFAGQAAMELVALNYHSQQMTPVVLTDLCTNSCVVLTFALESGKLTILKYSDVTLDQMAIFVRSHLDQNCSTIRNYSLPVDADVGIKESEMVMKEWKRARVSDITSSLQWEHFQEMMEDAPVGSKERAMVIREHFRHHELPDSSYLSMFS